MFKSFFYLLDNKAKNKIPFLVSAFIVLSVLDITGVGLVGTFLGILTNNESKLWFLSFLPMAAHYSHNALIVSFGLLLVSVFIIKSCITLFIQKKIVVFCQALAVRLKLRLMSCYLNAHYALHLQKNTAYMLTRVQNSIDQFVNQVLMTSLNFVSNSIIVTFVLGFLLILNPIPTLLLILMFSVLGIFYDYFTKHSLQKIGKVVAVTHGEISKNIHQGLHGLAEIRVFGKEDYFLNEIKNSSDRYSDAYGSLVFFQQMPRYLVESLIALFLVLLTLISIELKFSTVAIVSLCGMFAAAGFRLLPLVNQMMSGINQIRGSYHNVNLLYEELISLTEHPLVSPSNEDKNTVNFKQVKLQKIKYRYPNSKNYVLNDINMTINKGQFIGLIGGSGAGKSTLVNIILGLLEPQCGQLMIDGEPLRDTRSWLNNFAYIPQRIFLMDDSLKNNIGFGTAKSHINIEKIWQAIEMAQLKEVVDALPNGIETIIGENGALLSGGQRQRIAIARAFYHEREIIIMDEATSALDEKTESEFINTIQSLKGKKTFIIISHRLSTLEHCDTLYQMEAGCINNSFKSK